MNEYAVGSYAIVRGIGNTKKSGHPDFTGKVGKRYKIIRIENCTGNADGSCVGCPGSPVVLLNGEETHLCGWGAPGTNFLFESSDWDE